MTRRRSEKAFTLAGLLLALGLTAALLAAVAAAFHASILSYGQNEKLAAATQAARSVMDRITRDIRAAEAVSADGSEIVIVPPDDGSQTEQIRYEYDYQRKRLYYHRTVAGVTSTYPLLGTDGVQLTTFHVTSELGQDWQGTPCTKNVTVRVEFRLGAQVTSVTASAAPRRNQLY